MSSAGGITWTTVRVDGRCTACGMCLSTCPERALLAAPLKPLVLDRRCTACGACIEVCPAGALSEAYSVAGRRTEGSRT